MQIDLPAARRDLARAGILAHAVMLAPEGADPALLALARATDALCESVVPLLLASSGRRTNRAA
jgi:hypothetical protein